jgi:chromosome segregation ATPase
MERVERRLDAIDTTVGELRGDVTQLRSEVGGLRGEVGELRGEVGELRGEVGELRGEVGELRGEVGELRGDVGELRGDVGELRGGMGALQQGFNELRIVVESHDTRIGLIAEVQAHHGRQLEEHGAMLRRINEQLAPLADLRDFVMRVADNHERRITELEKRPGAS